MSNQPIFIIFTTFICFTLVSISASAEQIPKSLTTDQRIKIVTYDPNNVTLIHAYLGYQTEILFDADEVVQSVSMGDALAWQAVPVNNYLFLKPVAASNTNMTVLTNQRDYNFQLQVSDSTKFKNQTYKLKFIYPDLMPSPKTSANRLISCRLANVNNKYSYTGDKTIAPIEACDDGKFTYFKFKLDGSHDIPALFSVDKERNETLLNYHLDKQYVVVNRVAKQFTLRHGNEVASVYNDDAIGDWQYVRGAKPCH